VARDLEGEREQPREERESPAQRHREPAQEERGRHGREQHRVREVGADQHAALPVAVDPARDGETEREGGQHARSAEPGHRLRGRVPARSRRRR
jgi:hypothetical protein